MESLIRSMMPLVANYLDISRWNVLCRNAVLIRQFSLIDLLQTYSGNEGKFIEERLDRARLHHLESGL